MLWFRLCYLTVPDLYFLVFVQGEARKSVISGILADFGNYFFQPVMATYIIENFTFWDFFTFLRWSKKILDFLKIGNIFVNKNGANHELMAKFQFY